MRVRFLGGLGAKTIRISPEAEPVPVGEIVDLPERSIAVMRAHRYNFETVDDGDVLPMPLRRVPESLRRSEQQAEIRRMREEHELHLLREQERIRTERGEEVPGPPEAEQNEQAEDGSPSED